MSAYIKGASQMVSALNQFDKDLKKNLNRDVRAFLAPVVKQAKSYVPNTIPGLSNWTFNAPAKQINKHTTQFRRGKFPKFNARAVRGGIRTHVGTTRINNRGFVSLYRIENATAAGAILETAGRKNPGGQPWNKSSKSHDYSHSNNPDAGLHFNNSFAQMKGQGMMRGRVIYKAWEENQGKALLSAVKAVNETELTFKRRTQARGAFKVAV